MTRQNINYLVKVGHLRAIRPHGVWMVSIEDIATYTGLVRGSEH